jgi:hypothetical protein
MLMASCVTKRKINSFEFRNIKVPSQKIKFETAFDKQILFGFF